MAAGNPYSRMINTIRSEGAHNNGFQMEKAKVISIKPLVISYNNVPVTSNLYCNGVLTSDFEIENITEQEATISPVLKEFLNSVYNMVKLNVGDTVIVQRVENNFYILGKV